MGLRHHVRVWAGGAEDSTHCTDASAAQGRPHCSPAAHLATPGLKGRLRTPQSIPVPSVPTTDPQGRGEGQRPQSAQGGSPADISAGRPAVSHECSGPPGTARGLRAAGGRVAGRRRTRRAAGFRLAKRCGPRPTCLTPQTPCRPAPCAGRPWGGLRPRPAAAGRARGSSPPAPHHRGRLSATALQESEGHLGPGRQLWVGLCAEHAGPVPGARVRPWRPWQLPSVCPIQVLGRGTGARAAGAGRGQLPLVDMGHFCTGTAAGAGSLGHRRRAGLPGEGRTGREASQGKGPAP